MSPMKPLDALHMQLRLEGLAIADGSRLRQVEVVPGGEMPLMALAQLAGDRTVAYFDETLHEDLYAELMEPARHIHFPVLDPFIQILEARSLPFHFGHYRTYLFPETFLDFTCRDVECRSKSDRDVRSFGFGDFVENVYVVERGGKIASACVSSRENEWCGEAWVCTDPHYRRHGLARLVVSAWARDLLAAGKVPFYSHKMDNTASAGLANRLGLLPAFEEIVISYADVSFPHNLR